MNDLKNVINLCNILSEKRKEIEKLKHKLEELQEEEAKLSGVVIPNILLNMGVNSIKLDNGFTVEVDDIVYVSIPKDDLEKRKEALSFIKDNGGEGLIKEELKIYRPDDVVKNLLKDNNIYFQEFEDIHPATLKAFIKNLLGLSKNSVAVKSIEDIPKSLNVFLSKKTILK